jgi:hypothetical protein
LIFDDVHSSACNIGHFLGQKKCLHTCTLFSEMKLSTNLDLIWNVICFFFLLFLCMMCYLQLHNTRLSSIFMCFSFFFVCGKFEIGEVFFFFYYVKTFWYLTTFTVQRCNIEHFLGQAFSGIFFCFLKCIGKKLQFWN